jgi:N-carbamoylputrescine amidase
LRTHRKVPHGRQSSNFNHINKYSGCQVQVVESCQLKGGRTVIEETKKILRVAVVQVASENGKIAENLKHATSFVEEAAERGAKLILLPEFMSTGYIFTEEIWDAGEPKEGPTVKWMKDLSKKLGVWLGTSYLEADGEDFYNTFVITNPEGSEDGRVRKQTPAVGEAYFTKGDSGTHVINTQLGKIGVGICYENRLSYMPKLMFKQSVDLMLQPHAVPVPKISRMVPLKQSDRSRTDLGNRSKYYADMLGIPVILSNKSGKWSSPLPGMPFLHQDTSFVGLSSIADSDGTLKVKLGADEGVIVEDITLNPALKKKAPPTTHGRWSMPDIPWIMNVVVLIEAIGGVCYQFSRERKLRAKAISSRL